jgi:hypothetical protein
LGTVKVSKIHGMLAHRAETAPPFELFEVKMTKFKAGVMSCSLLSAAGAHEPDLKALHANVAAFIEKTKSGMAGPTS